MSDLRVLIVGASIAGPTAAYWFAKAGADVTVIERFPALRTNGQSIDIRTVGVTVMRKMPGMEEAVRANKAPLNGFQLVHDDGSEIFTIEPTGDPDQQSLVSEYEIFRGDLARILVDLSKQHQRVKYVFNEQVSAVRQPADEKDGPVQVEFANGYPAGEYDLVVACDGATSRTRALGLQCGVRDHLRPLNCWAAFFSIPEDLINGSTRGYAHTTPGGRFVSVGPLRCGTNTVGILSIQPRDRADLTAAFREALKDGDEALKTYVSGWLAGAGWKSKEITAAIPTADDFYCTEIVQVKVPQLSRGRFVLVGDAGYCPSNFTGAGTSLAIAGAYVLAGEVGAHPGDLQAALAAYEARMRPLIDDMQTIPPGMPGLLAPQGAWGIWLRNTVVVAVLAVARLASYFSFLGGWFSSSLGKDKFQLPAYTWAS